MEGKGNQESQTVTQDWGKKIKERHLTEASAVPRAAQQALFRAGSQELLRGQAAARPPLGGHSLISPAARGSASCIPECFSKRDCRGHGVWPHWTDEACGILRDPGRGLGHTESQHGQVRTSIQAIMLVWGDHNSPTATLFLLLSEQGVCEEG